jgi:hypothetical protein
MPAAKRTARKATTPAATAKPSKRRFNPLAEHGTVSPPDRGAVFWQDGGYFTASGELVFEDHPASVEVVTSEQTTVDAATGETTTTIVEETVKTADQTDPRLALAAWLKGEIKLNHFAAINYAKDAFGVVLRKKDELIDYLVNTANLVPAEQVKVDD